MAKPSKRTRPYSLHLLQGIRSFRIILLILDKVFQRTNKIEYFNESISRRHQVLGHPLPQFLRRMTYHPGHSTQDMNEGLEIFSQYVNNGHVDLPRLSRISLACVWEFVARAERYPSVPTAYESLMQDIHQLFSCRIPLSPRRLTRMPLDYASYQVDLHQPEEAMARPTTLGR